MMANTIGICIHILLILSLVTCSAITYPQNKLSKNELVLNKGWFIQSSGKVTGDGSIISTQNYSVCNWYSAEVPSTVMGTLVKDNVYKNVFADDNLAKIPTGQFEKSWWYRNEFILPPQKSGKTIKLKFEGIIYRANIWLNGKQIASSDSIAGVYRMFEFDVSKIIKLKEKNALAVEVFPPVPGEPSIGFVDWNPKPPDNSMGIWRQVKLKISGDVSIKYPFVQSKINLGTLKSAELTVSTELFNNNDKNISGILYGEIDKIKFFQTINLKPYEERIITFAQEDFHQLKIKNPRLWWIYTLGKPELYKLKLKLCIDGKISDESETQFGIREISDYMNEDGYRGYKLNGKKILILGGGWVDNLFLNNDYKNLKAQIKYVKQMGLNAIRLEGIWGTSEDLFNLCDENGILIMAGWSCQWEWDIYIGKPVDDYGGIKTQKEMDLISSSWQDQIRWLRNHPCIFVWMYGSDKIPRPELEKKYLQILQNYVPASPHLTAAKQMSSEISGQTGVKMRGPYDYVPPMYWWIDKDNGGAFGFNTEAGPGAEVPPIESIKKMFTQNHLWHIDSVWYFHCGRNDFGDLKNYNDALYNRLSAPNSLEEYCTKAQLINYDGTRAMFEAYVANKYKATGVIHWMLNSAWPKLWWQLYDFYLMPGGAFYGTKKACEPTHILYNYATAEIIAVNNTLQQQDNLTAKILILNFNLTEKYSKTISLKLSPDESVTILQLPSFNDLSKTYFIDLKLFSGKKIISSNFYALSTKPDVLDTVKTTWILTPTKEYADLTKLNKLKNVHLNIKQKFIRTNEKEEVEAELFNNTNELAFQIVLSVQKDRDGESVLPIFWEDNYFSLLPGEKRKIRGSFHKEDLDGKRPFLKVSGWNIE